MKSKEKKFNINFSGILRNFDENEKMFLVGIYLKQMIFKMTSKNVTYLLSFSIEDLGEYEVKSKEKFNDIAKNADLTNICIEVAGFRMTLHE